MVNKLRQYSDTSLNIPLGLINENKVSLDMLCVAALIKQTYTNSVILNVSSKAIKGLCHCSFVTAQKLLKQMHECSLFRFRGTQCTALSFKKRFVSVSTDKKGNHAYSIISYKYNKGECVTLKEMKAKMRQILLERAVLGAARKLNKYNDVQKQSCVLAPMYRTSLANAIGMSKDSVIRLVKTMGGKIAVKGISCFIVRNTPVGSMPADSFVAYGSVLVRHASLYLLLDSESKRFKHIILNHKKRMSQNFMPTNIMETELMAAYN